MPAMPRPSKKAKRIAYSILGKPNNMRKETRKRKKIRRVLNRQYTALAR